MFDIEVVLTKLSKMSPIFYSEADFQHSLAWKIHEMYPEVNLRLEKREEINGEELYVDIFAFKNDEICALELKYKTKKFDITLASEKISIKKTMVLMISIDMIFVRILNG